MSKMLDSDILTLLSKYGSFDNICDINTAIKNLILPLESYLDNFIFGTNKLVLFFKDYDYVVKIPYKSLSFTKQWNQISFPIIQEENLIKYIKKYNFLWKDLQLPLIPLENEIYPIYKQKKATPFEKKYTDKNSLKYEQYKIDYLNKLFSAKNFTLFTNLIKFNPYLVIWFYDVGNYYGEEILIDFVEFISCLKKYDLQIKNLGYIENQPVLLDIILV